MTFSFDMERKPFSKYNVHEMDDLFLSRLLSNASANGVDASFRRDLAIHGQHPNAVILCCSDSRVSPEVIFNVGLGELFVIRTAGNTLGENEYRSIEYAYHHLGVKRLIVMAHTHCGAIGAALSDPSDENPLICCIHQHIKDERDPDEASKLNALKVKEEVLQRLPDLSVYVLLYDIEDGSLNTIEKE